MALSFLSLADRRLAYQRQLGALKSPAILFLGGFASDMNGSKASFLASRAAETGRSFLRFDYRGHGSSSGSFADMTLGDWLDDAQAVLDNLTDGPQIVIGSSMGGWIGLLLAKARPDRFKAFIGVAAAPDFTEDLVWDKLSPSDREILRQGGSLDDGGAPITLKLIQEARKHLVLRSPLALSFPVRLLQGMHDEDVPWQHAPRIAQHISAPDVRVTLVKDGNHSLSAPENLELLWETIEAFL